MALFTYWETLLFWAVETGSVVLKGLPETGTWTVNPGGITGTGTSTTISGLAPGTYSHTVTNAEGCTSAASANVVITAQSSTLAAPTVTLIQPTCLVTTGTITVVSPKETGMTYSIDNLTYTNTTGIFTLVLAGTYTVTSKDANGCISAVTIVTINATEISWGCVSAGTIVTINTQPGPPVEPGAITGTAAVCKGQTGYIYSVPVITNATDYIWTLPTGATITAGANTNSITVAFSDISLSGDITVQGSNSCATGTVSAPFKVVVNNCKGHLRNINEWSTSQNEFGLKVYPNPFTDHLCFDLQMEKDAKVRLEIFNHKGYKIATLFSDDVKAFNYYRIEYTPENNSTGAILYRLIIDEQLVLTGKVIHK